MVKLKIAHNFFEDSKASYFPTKSEKNGRATHIKYLTEKTLI